jgi:hypothetical protein
MAMAGHDGALDRLARPSAQALPSVPANIGATRAKHGETMKRTPVRRNRPIPKICTIAGPVQQANTGNSLRCNDADHDASTSYLRRSVGVSIARAPSLAPRRVAEISGAANNFVAPYAEGRELSNSGGAWLGFGIERLC